MILTTIIAIGLSSKTVEKVPLVANVRVGGGVPTASNNLLSYVSVPLPLWGAHQDHLKSTYSVEKGSPRQLPLYSLSFPVLTGQVSMLTLYSGKRTGLRDRKHSYQSICH